MSGRVHSHTTSVLLCVRCKEGLAEVLPAGRLHIILYDIDIILNNIKGIFWSTILVDELV